MWLLWPEIEISSAMFYRNKQHKFRRGGGYKAIRKWKEDPVIRYDGCDINIKVNIYTMLIGQTGGGVETWEEDVWGSEVVSGHHGVSGSVAQCPLRCVATGARPGKYTWIINLRYLYYLQCSPVSSLPTLHRAVCAAQCPAAGCCDCSPAPAASP